MSSAGFQSYGSIHGCLLGCGVRILKHAWGRVDIQHSDGSVVSIHERRLLAYLEELRDQQPTPPLETSASARRAQHRAEKQHRTWRSRVITEASCQPPFSDHSPSHFR